MRALADSEVVKAPLPVGGLLCMPPHSVYWVVRRSHSDTGTEFQRAELLDGHLPEFICEREAKPCGIS